jgi:hypothetical protein
VSLAGLRSRMGASSLEYIFPTPSASWNASTISSDALTDTTGNGNNARLGSSVGSDSADPLQLLHVSDDVYAPGATGQVNNIMDGTGSPIASTNSLTFALRFKLIDTSSTVRRLCGWQANDAGLYLQTDGRLTVFAKSTTSVFLGNAPSSSALPAPSGEYVWWRGILNLNSGLCTYYYSQDDTDEYDTISWTEHSSATGTTLTGLSLKVTFSGRYIIGSTGTTLTGTEGRYRRFVHYESTVLRANWYGNGGGPPWQQYTGSDGNTWVYARASTGRKTTAVTGGSQLLAGPDDYCEAPNSVNLNIPTP